MRLRILERMKWAYHVKWIYRMHVRQWIRYMKKWMRHILYWPLTIADRFQAVTMDLEQADEFFQWAIGIPNHGVYNAGWLYGAPEDRRKLRQIGVRGRMTYSDGAFSHCMTSDEVMKRLLVVGWLSYPGSFTRVNMSTGIQLPRRKQIWWQWPSKNDLVYNGYVKGKRCWGPGNPAVWPWQRRK